MRREGIGKDFLPPHFVYDFSVKCLIYMFD